MPSMTIRRLLCALVVLVGVGVGGGGGAGARADDHHDHDRAREALLAGRVLPLEDIVAKVKHDFPGSILDVEFEDEHGRLIYEIKTITTDGRVLKLKYDATTGLLLEAKGRKRGRNGR